MKNAYKTNSALSFQDVFHKTVISVPKAVICFLKSGYWMVPLFWGFTIVLISPRFGGEYSQDSFAYILLGKNIYGEFGYVSQAIRDFYLEASGDYFQPSRSFPPLWPLIVGSLDAISGKGITSTLIANIFVLFLVFHVYFLLCKKMLPRGYWVCFALLLYFIVNNDSPDSFVAEIVSGRTIPMALLLFLCVCLMLSDDELSKSKQVFLGACLGGLYLVRFDTLVFLVFVISFIAIKRSNWLRVVSLACICVLFPWLLRNAFVFGQTLASDNFVTAFSTYPGIAQIAWFDGAVPVWLKDPNLWAVQRAGYILANMKIFASLLTPFGGLFVLSISLYSLLDTQVPKVVKTISILAWLWLVANLLSVSLTPYHDNRYFSISVFAISFSGLLTLVSKLVPITYNDGNKDIASGNLNCGRVCLLSYVIVVVLITTPAIYFFVRSPLKLGDRNAQGYICQYNEFKNYVEKNELVSTAAAEHLAYYSKWRTIYLPINLTEADDRFVSWVKKLNVGYAIIPDSSKLVAHPKVVLKAQSCGVILADLRGLRHD